MQAVSPDRVPHLSRHPAPNTTWRDVVLSEVMAEEGELFPHADPADLVRSNTSYERLLAVDYDRASS